MRPRPVILCKLGLKLTASVSVSLLLFCPTGPLQFLHLPPDAASGSIPCVSVSVPSSFLVPQFSALCLCSVSLPPAAQPLSAWGRDWGHIVGGPASLGQLKGPRLSAGPGSVQPGPREGPQRTICLVLRASLWSSCVVLPLLALTWMSAVLAMTDRRSVLFQALFAVFNSAQGFVITAVHCFLRREVGWASPGPRPPLPATMPDPCRSPWCRRAQLGRIKAQTRPPFGQLLVWKLITWAALAPLGLLLPTPLGWIHCFPSMPIWVPGVEGTARCSQGAL